MDVRFSCFNLFFIGTQEGYAVLFFRKEESANPLASGPGCAFFGERVVLCRATANPKKPMPIKASPKPSPEGRASK
jgi:hypothetical protein